MFNYSLTGDSLNAGDAAAAQPAEAIQAAEGAEGAEGSEGVQPADQETAATSEDQAIEGSGGVADAAVPASGFFSLPTFPAFPSFFSSGLFGTSRDFIDDNDDLVTISSRQGRQIFDSDCKDRITLPCVVEDFIGAGMGNVPSCLPVHCGDSLCDFGALPCRIESTVKPFGLGFHFGDGQSQDKGGPEDNIGACLKYNQVSCG